MFSTLHVDHESRHAQPLPFGSRLLTSQPCATKTDCKSTCVVTNIRVSRLVYLAAFGTHTIRSIFAVFNLDVRFFRDLFNLLLRPPHPLYLPGILAGSLLPSQDPFLATPPHFLIATLTSSVNGSHRPCRLSGLLPVMPKQGACAWLVFCAAIGQRSPYSLACARAPT